MWKTKKGKIEIRFERLISMVTNEVGAQRLVITSKGYTGQIRVCAGLDFNTTHGTERMNLWECETMEDHRGHISGRTKNTGMEVESFCFLTGSMVERSQVQMVKGEKFVAEEYTFSLTENQSQTLDKIVWNVTPLAPKRTRSEIMDQLEALHFDDLYQSNYVWWDQVWQKSDITISREFGSVFSRCFRRITEQSAERILEPKD